MTDNQKLALEYLQNIGSTTEYKPVDFFLMVQDTGLTIQDCSSALDDLEKTRTVDVMDGQKITLFKLR